MNAGYGIGDIIAVSQLAWSVYTSCKEAPSNFGSISSEVHSLHIVLKKTEEVFLTRQLNGDTEGLRELVIGCREVLTDLENLLAKFKRLGDGNSMVTLNRFRWSQGNVTALRDHIVSNSTMLGAFCATDQMCIFMTSFD